MLDDFPYFSQAKSILSLASNANTVDDLLIEVEPLIRPAVSSALDSVQKLLDEDEITFQVAKSIDDIIFSAIDDYNELNPKAKINFMIKERYSLTFASNSIGKFVAKPPLSKDKKT